MALAWELAPFRERHPDPGASRPELVVELDKHSIRLKLDDEDLAALVMSA